MARKIKYVYWRDGWAHGRKTHNGHEHRCALETQSATVAAQRVIEWIDKLKAANWGEKPSRSFADAVNLTTDRHLPRLKRSTRVRYVHSLLNLAQHLGDLGLDDVGSAELAKFEQARREAGISPATIRRDLATLSVVYETAIEAEWTDRNPAKAFLRSARRRGLTESPPRARFLTREEETAILAVAPPMLAAFVTLSTSLGLRSDELLGLTWTDVHLARREVYVQPTRSKTRIGRRVPITDTARDVFCSLPQHPDGLIVLHTARGGRHAEMWHRFQKAAAAAGVPDVTVHDLRRTCGVRLLRGDGVPRPLSMEAVSKWLGHSSIKTTERHYAFLSVDELHKAVGTAAAQMPDATHGLLDQLIDIEDEI